jgi:hypothetical protein
LITTEKRILLTIFLIISQISQKANKRLAMAETGILFDVEESLINGCTGAKHINLEQKKEHTTLIWQLLK